MDIAVADLSFIEVAKELLKSHPVNFAIESYPRFDGYYTYRQIDPNFAETGDDFLLSNFFQQFVHDARPRLRFPR